MAHRNKERHGKLSLTLLAIGLPLLLVSMFIVKNAYLQWMSALCLLAAAWCGILTMEGFFEDKSEAMDMEES